MILIAMMSDNQLKPTLRLISRAWSDQRSLSSGSSDSDRRLPRPIEPASERQSLAFFSVTSGSHCSFFWNGFRLEKFDPGDEHPRTVNNPITTNPAASTDVRILMSILLPSRVQKGVGSRSAMHPSGRSGKDSRPLFEQCPIPL